MCLGIVQETAHAGSSSCTVQPSIITCSIQQIAAINPEFDLLLCDLRGQGESRLAQGTRVHINDMVKDTVALFQTLGIEKAILIGHSFGGNVAQEVAFRHPELVEKLVMIGSRGQHWIISRQEKFKLLMASPTYRLTPWKKFAAYCGQWSSTNPETRAYIETCVLRTGRKVYMDLGMSGFRTLHEVAVYPVPTPTLLVRGEFDSPLALDAIYADIASKNPNTVRAIIPDCGHQPLQDQPEAFNRVLFQFIQSSLARSQQICPVYTVQDVMVVETIARVTERT